MGVDAHLSASERLPITRDSALSKDGWSGVDERATSISNDYGNINLAIATADAPTGLPAADAVIMGWAQRVRVPKVSGVLIGCEKWLTGPGGPAT